jgi:hypothetical protein
MVQVELVVLMV